MTRIELHQAVRDLHTDIDFAELARQYGLRELACLFDGKDPASQYTLREFSGDNHFAHLLCRGRDPDTAL